MQLFMNLIPGRKGAAVADTSEAVMEAVRDRERGAGDFITAVDSGNVRPMVEVVWEGALKARTRPCPRCFGEASAPLT